MMTVGLDRKKALQEKQGFEHRLRFGCTFLAAVEDFSGREGHSFNKAVILLATEGLIARQEREKRASNAGEKAA